MPHDRDARPDSTDKDASSIAELAMTVDALAERLEAAEIAIRALQDNEKNAKAPKPSHGTQSAPLTR